MKKFIFILVAVMLAVSVNAQEKHLKFMGIPLNLTITEFQNKLIAKGFKIATINELIKQNRRVFEGTFCGYDAKVQTYYIGSSKIVYRAKVYITDYNESLILKRFDLFKGMLSEKYGSFDYCDKQDGYDNISWIVYDPNDTEKNYETSIGLISLYISVFEGIYCINIDYGDRLNEDKQIQELSKDL